MRTSITYRPRLIHFISLKIITFMTSLSPHLPLTRRLAQGLRMPSQHYYSCTLNALRMVIQQQRSGT